MQDRDFFKIYVINHLDKKPFNFTQHTFYVVNNFQIGETFGSTKENTMVRGKIVWKCAPGGARYLISYIQPLNTDGVSPKTNVSTNLSIVS